MWFKGGNANPETAQKEDQARQAQEDAKNSILSQILDQSARARRKYLQQKYLYEEQVLRHVIL